MNPCLTKIWFYLFSLLLVINVAFADEVTWPEPDFPPFVFFDDVEGMQDKGIDQLSIHYLVQRMPKNWNHIFEKANYKRIVKDIVNKRRKIIAGLFKNQSRIDEGVAYSQVPMHLVLPNHVVILEANKDKFLEFMVLGKIDLEKLIISTKYTVGVSHGRSYSGFIDTVLNRHREKIMTRSASDEIGLFKMLKQHKVDAIFEFPISAEYIARKLNIKNEILLVPVLGMEEFTEAFIAAPSNDWGKAKLKVIDQIMSEPETIKNFTLFYSNWLPNTISKSDYHEVVKKYYDKMHHIQVQF
jgi:uncharacterized protein (TIGR02285 family)